MALGGTSFGVMGTDAGAQSAVVLSRAMRRRVLGGLPAVALFAASLACAPAASAKDVTITSFDGTRIAAHWFVGKGLGPGERAPTVLEGPGWSSGGDTDSSGGSGGSGAGAIFGVPGISGFIDHGYNVLTWDPRGFGQSGGTVEIDDPRYEGRDVQALINWVAKQPEAQMDLSCSQRKGKAKRKRSRKRGRRLVTCATSSDDPTIGMAGASYGGGIQLVAAGLDRRIDAIAPTIAWHSLLTALFPEGDIKLGWGSILVAAGVEGTLPGGASSPATAAGRQDPHFYSTLTNGVATGTTTQDDLDWMASHGPGELLKRIQVPTLLLQGTVDTLFPLDEAVANFDEIGQNPLRTAAIKAKAKRKKGKRKRKRRVSGPVQRVPVKMVWFCGGHGVCLTDPGPGSAYLDQRTLAWFDRYLRGKPDVDTGPKFAWIADDGQLRSSDAYPLASAGRLHASGSGSLPIVPGQGSGSLIFATQASNAVNVPLPGPSADANVLGAPHVDLTYQGTAAPANTFVYAQFVNPRNGTVLGNMATPIPVTLDGQQHTVSRDLELVAGRAPAGGGYTLQLTPSSSLYDQQRSAGVVTFSSVDVTMPLSDPVAASQSAVAKHKKKRKRKHRR
jgi:ABC-2 type transport system ATP-binding protein